jgi:hypothetical protein
LAALERPFAATAITGFVSEPAQEPEAKYLYDKVNEQANTAIAIIQPK